MRRNGDREWSFRLIGLLIGWAALAIVVVAVTGCERGDNPPPDTTPCNIVLIVIDTLRADHLGSYGYFRDTSPNIDAFADEAVLFDQAYAPMATTLPSHTSLFTGLHPVEHGILANVGDGGHPFRSKPGLRTITQYAKEAGYATAAFIGAVPLKRVCGLDAGFDTYVEPDGAQADAGPTTDAVLKWLDEHGRERFFAFVHYFDTHVPYTPPPPYRGMFESDDMLRAYIAERAIPPVVEPGLCRGRVATFTERATNLYDGEVRYCDAHVGRLLDSLRERGLWDKSLIIIAADHGEGLNQHAWPQHGRNWNEQVHVPLMFRPPGGRGGLPARVGSLVTLMDVFPTVLGVMKPGWASSYVDQATGRDVLGADFVERPVLARRSLRDCGEFGGPLFSLTTPDWRYHYFSADKELLFGRASDPFELHDVAGSNAAVAGELRRQTLELVAKYEKHRTEVGVDASGAVQLDPALQRQMESIGYLGGSSPDDDEEEEPASQPSAGDAGP